MESSPRREVDYLMSVFYVTFMVLMTILGLYLYSKISTKIISNTRSDFSEVAVTMPAEQPASSK